MSYFPQYVTVCVSNAASQVEKRKRTQHVSLLMIKKSNRHFSHQSMIFQAVPFE